MSASRKSVSIVIPAFNESKVILNCLNSILAQVDTPDEVLVIDNKSTDNTVAAVAEFIAKAELKHPEKVGLFKLLHQDEEQGLIPTRNFGIDQAKSDIIGRIDADSILSPNWVKVLREAFGADSALMGVTGPVTYYDMPLRKFSQKQDDRIRQIIEAQSKDVPLFFGTNMAITARAWAKIRTEACLDIEGILHEDVDLSVHFALNGLRVEYLSELVAGMSARRIEDKFSDFLSYQQRMITTFEQHGLEPTRGAKAGRVIFLALWFALHFIRPAYLKRYEKRKDEYIAQLWNGIGG